MGEELEFKNDPADPLIIPVDIWNKLGFGREPVYAEVTIQKIPPCKKHTWYDYQAIDGNYYRCCEKCGMTILDTREEDDRA